jgi:CRISPR-associated protein Csh2
MNNIIKNRYEILFLYECKDCNPNGDPLDENRPRTDAETGQATITDVRIKRTIRDYLLGKNPNVENRLKEGMEILIRDTLKNDGFLSEGKDRAEQFLKTIEKEAKKGEKRYILQNAILKHCIDARLFGCALPIEKSSVQITGPVQFSAFNRSLHRVSPIMVQQTAAFAGNAKAEQKSFAERWLVPYALIASYAVINEVSAQTSQMTNNDLSELLEAIWQGTASLNTHSKIGHDPMLLVVAEYEPMQRLGALTTRISLMDKTKEDTALRSTEDYKVNISNLLEEFKNFKGLKNLKIRQDARLQLKSNDQVGDFMSLAKQAGLPVTEL